METKIDIKTIKAELRLIKQYDYSIKALTAVIGERLEILAAADKVLRRDTKRKFKLENMLEKANILFQKYDECIARLEPIDAAMLMSCYYVGKSSEIVGAEVGYSAASVLIHNNKSIRLIAEMLSEKAEAGEE